MEPILSSFPLKSTDLRTALNIAPATLNEILKKNDVQYLPNSSKAGRGAAKSLAGRDVRRVLEARGFEYPSPAQTMSFMMCKGGVGKTTSSFFLAQRLTSYGAKVLLIDGDSQGNLTAAFNWADYGIEIDEETPILVDVITGDAILDEAIIALTPDLHLIPSTPMNATLEGKIRDKVKNPAMPIRRAIEPFGNRYDYIIFDCAPALNLTNTAIMASCDEVILPVAPDKFSQLGLKQTLEELETINRDFGLNIGSRIVFTRFDAREYTSLKFLSEIVESNTNRMFQTTIRTAADLKNAIAKRENLFDYRKSNGKEDYDAFAKEVLGIDKFIEKK